MMEPLISIIVPCYNQAEFLSDALNSVLCQEYKNWECIIVNDGSSDNTLEVASVWLKKDERFKYLQQENNGVSNCRNNGILKSRGEFILPLDADDKISNNYISLIIRAFLRDSNLKVVYSEAVKFGEVEGRWDLNDFSLIELAKSNMIYSSAIFKKCDWLRVGGYDENMHSGLEDWEIWIAILKEGGGVKRLGFDGFYYRVKKKSRTTGVSSKDFVSIYEYLSVKHADFYVKNFGSFHHLNDLLLKQNKNFEEKLKSEKFIIDVFCKKVFNKSLFGKYD
ncbi:Glycosyl transferase family 2 [Salegentibacter agarivorans]|uniref:Glycosyl transferase family 2 n=1 Tax=Salegentibacter agarivorans TaxID=345907 RepID=A0A1I2LB16_9FLAO|nr:MULTISPECIES: glycosyltransferase family A protein [Salegentibacter]APS38800.1 glycosyl transferase family 2 [Salegentibacter sp. T436]SFF74381.1 Glycosyl transferase family 2 [Salegentibacter agarivorans]